MSPLGSIVVVEAHHTWALLQIIDLVLVVLVVVVLIIEHIPSSTMAIIISMVLGPRATHTHLMIILVLVPLLQTAPRHAHTHTCTH